MFRCLIAVVQPLLASSSSMHAVLRYRRITAMTFLYQTVERPEKRENEALPYESRCWRVVEEITRLREQSGELGLDGSKGPVGCLSERLSPELVLEMLKLLRNDADTAFFLFKWAGKQEVYEHDTRTYNQIIKLLASANRFEDIEFVLVEMMETGYSVEWESALELVVSYANGGMVDRAHDIFHQLRQHRRRIPSEVYISIFNALGKMQRYEEVDCIVKELMRQGTDVLDHSMSEALVRMFCKGGKVHKAVRLLSEVAKDGLDVTPGVFSMVAHSLCKLAKEDTALAFFEEMCSLSEFDDKLLMCHGLISGVVRASGLSKASKIIRELAHRGLLWCILDFQFPSGAQQFSITDILELFGHMNIVLSTLDYNCFIEGLCKANKLEVAQEVYDLMRDNGVAPDIYTYNHIVECISRAGRVEDALTLLEAMEQTSCKPDIFTYTSILNGLCRLGKLEDALILYRRMKEAGCSPDAVTFGCMINGFCKASKFDEALVILNASIEAGYEPDEVTYSSIIDPLCSLQYWDSALKVFELARGRNCPGSIFLYSRLMNCLRKSGKLETACQLLQDMCSGESKSGQLLAGEVCEPNVVIYNTVIDGLCGAGKLEEAYLVVKAMEAQGVKADVVTYTTFLHALCGGGRLDDALKLLQMMVKAGCVPDVIAYNTLIAALCSATREEEACRIFQAMLENGCEPNAFTFSHLITALCRMNKLDAAMHLFNYMKLLRCVPELVTYKELIYGNYKHGKRQEARRLLERESKAFSMNNPGKSLVSELHETGNFYERRQLSNILSQDCFQR